MQVRPFRPSDAPQLAAMAEAAGFEYANPQNPHIEACMVVADDDDRPIMACAAERLVQLYLWTSEMPPGAKLAAIRMLTMPLGDKLRELGYESAEAFIPPQIQKTFGRRLERLGWRKNWPSWFRRL